MWAPEEWVLVCKLPSTLTKTFFSDYVNTLLVFFVQRMGIDVDFPWQMDWQCFTQARAFQQVVGLPLAQ
jgi:hypothetical protein